MNWAQEKRLIQEYVGDLPPYLCVARDFSSRKFELKGYGDADEGMEIAIDIEDLDWLAAAIPKIREVFVADETPELWATFLAKVSSLSESEKGSGS